MNGQSANSSDSQSSDEYANEAPPEWTSSQILDGHSEAIIVHAGEVYRLRCTRNNKLILTK
ncbi:MAG: hemin uptake protein HemP [Planctomycetes bacterium]|nr:hemin uptake protein HemP [Planctomycetota bacterium]